MENVRNTVSTLKRIEKYILKKELIEEEYNKKKMDKDKIKAVRKIYGEELFKDVINKIENKYAKKLEEC